MSPENLKTNMEPENPPFEKEKSSIHLHFGVEFWSLFR